MRSRFTDCIGITRRLPRKRNTYTFWWKYAAPVWFTWAHDLFIPAAKQAEFYSNRAAIEPCMIFPNPFSPPPLRVVQSQKGEQHVLYQKYVYAIYVWLKRLGRFNFPRWFSEKMHFRTSFIFARNFFSNNNIHMYEITILGEKVYKNVWKLFETTYYEFTKVRGWRLFRFILKICIPSLAKFPIESFVGAKLFSKIKLVQREEL